MERNNNRGPVYTRVFGSVNPKIEKLIKEQFNPTLTHNPRGFKKELIKKIRKSVCVDSSYYLG